MSSLFLSDTRYVVIGSRPDGFVFINERSRFEKSVSARLLGIGVAVMLRRLGSFAFLIRELLCSTPKRCCSSMITYLRFLNVTSSVKRACVPIARSTFPDASAFRRSVLPFCDIAPVK